MTSNMFLTEGIRSSLFKWKYLKIKKLFINFLFHLWNVNQILKIFLKKMIVIANVFPKLQTVNDLVKPLSRKRSFRTSFGSQHVKGSQILVKSVGERFYHIFWWIWGEMTWKISLLLNVEILSVFVNILTTDENYPFGDSGDLQFPIQMQLSEKAKTFFVPLMESSSRFKYFLKKVHPDR